ncbi:midas domain-containing protein [Crateriforma conspicua]|uniref:hypothetical protein n=1 Tax=Crateriforma conspicua TaxID=2527996 RepID=UPI0011B7D221|nr:hypothetical protein [Crateriforma conspicua]
MVNDDSHLNGVESIDSSYDDGIVSDGEDHSSELNDDQYDDFDHLFDSSDVDRSNDYAVDDLVVVSSDDNATTLSDTSQSTSSHTDSLDDSDHGILGSDDFSSNEVELIDGSRDDNGIESLDEANDDGQNNESSSDHAEEYSELYDNEQYEDSSHDASESNDGDDYISTPVVSSPVVPPVTNVDVETNADIDSVSSPVSSIDPVVPVTPVVTPQQYGEWSGILSGTGYGKVEFERERGETEFEVEIRGVAANSSYPVTVGGVVVGQLVTNSRGQGKLKFEVGDDHYRPFLADFPMITAGVGVQVGDVLSGVFGQYFGDDDDDHDHDD